MISSSHGEKTAPAAAQIIPRIPASKRAVRTAQCSPSLSFAPKYLEIIIVAPVARPFIKLIGNLKSVCTESIAASPTFPVNCPTIDIPTLMISPNPRKYFMQSKSTFLPAISGSTKSNNAFPIFSEIRLSFFIIYCPFGTNGRQHCVHLPLPQVLDSLFCRYPYNAHIFPETGIPVEDPVGSEPHFQYSRLVWKSTY